MTAHMLSAKRIFFLGSPPLSSQILSMFFVGGPLMSIGSSEKYTSPLGATHSAVGASMAGASRTSSTWKPGGALGTGEAADSGATRTIRPMSASRRDIADNPFMRGAEVGNRYTITAGQDADNAT